MSVVAHVKVMPSTIPQLSNSPIIKALLDQCVNYYYSNWEGYKLREIVEGSLTHVYALIEQGASPEKETSEPSCRLHNTTFDKYNTLLQHAK